MNKPSGRRRKDPAHRPLPARPRTLALAAVLVVACTLGGYLTLSGTDDTTPTASATNRSPRQPLSGASGNRPGTARSR
ncbi:hypothetical protein Smic_83880 [Streptomyces microflavus]|uniref:Uncharacterized protein n=1 Tax=Streptomyces microflavus TaxID=1919 RepID=A0A7J0D521_STRMI|nr:hypothetical protein Smic_83880 [Streptomyces microflavus]